jgi:hypothetical protein
MDSLGYRDMDLQCVRRQLDALADERLSGWGPNDELRYLELGRRERALLMEIQERHVSGAGARP